MTLKMAGVKKSAEEEEERSVEDVDMEDSDEEEEEEEESGDESGDSDKELQIAFEKGLLKPGLFRVEEEKKKEHVNNVEGLKSALANFETKNKLDWAERLDVIAAPVPDTTGLNTGETTPAEKGKDASKDEAVHNDFQREMAIHRQAQGAWLHAVQKLRKLGIPTKRPDDYFAQMVKSDPHMRKVREKILSKQQSVELSEKMRKLRELKKYGKKVQQEVLAKRQKEKKNLADSVKKYRKGVQDKLDFMKSDDFGGIEAEDEKKRGKNNNNNNNNVAKKPQPNRKRVEKNKKFGHGGQKKRSKYNTSDSAADPFSGPKGKGKKFPGEARGGGRGGGGRGGGGRGGAGKGPKNKGARQGKSKRVANKNKKRS